MGMTPEGAVKKKVVEQMKELAMFDLFYFFPATGGYGTSGVPDIVGCFKGKFFAIECKAGSNKPTPLQEHAMKKIVSAGGRCLVVNEDNVDMVKSWLYLL